MHAPIPDVEMQDDEGLRPRNGPRLGPMLLRVLRKPQSLLAVWNWKSALLSVMFRGPIFFGAALTKGFAAALSALFVETFICALGVGLYNALVQTLRKAEPLWATGLLLSVVFPGCVQAIEYTIHRLRATPHLHTAAIISLCVSGFSTLFNWYAMRRGALMVGRNSSGLLVDLRHLPRLIFGFISEPFRLLRRRHRSDYSQAPEPTKPAQYQG